MLSEAALKLLIPLALIGLGLFLLFIPDRSLSHTIPTPTPTPTPIPTPLAPSSISAAALSTTQMYVSWGNVANEDGYKLDRSLDGSSWGQITTTNKDITNYTDAGRDESVEYFYRVRATNGGGDSVYSGSANRWTIPDDPDDLQAPSDSETQITWNWIDVSVGNTGYSLEWSLTGTAPWTVISLGGTVISHLHTGLSPSTRYYYQLAAFNPSYSSNYITANKWTRPSKPALAATAICDQQIDLSWTNVSTGTDGFRVERKEGAGGGWTPIATLGSNATSYSDTDPALLPATQYFYRVTAFTPSPSVDSLPSDEKSATTLALPVLLSVLPVGGATAVATNSNIDATFDVAMNAATQATFIASGSQTGRMTDAVYSGDATTTLTLNPANDFLPGEEIEVTLTDSLSRECGATLADGYVWKFVAAAGAGPAEFEHFSNDVGTTPTATYAIALADFDGDGDLDLAVGNDGQNFVYFNDGAGNFAGAPTPFGPSDSPTVALAIGDVDDDGDLDLIAGNYGDRNVVYINDGTGSFPDIDKVELGDAGFLDSTIGLALGDIDGDGDLDLAVGNGDDFQLGEQQNIIYFNEGGGLFSAGSLNFGSGSDNTQALAFGDVDGDGDLDLFVGNFAQPNTIYLNDGAGNLSVSAQGFGSENVYTRDLKLGDLNGDGRLDIVCGGYLQNYVYLQSAGGDFAQANPFGTADEWTMSIALGDIDGDGDLDVAVGNGENFESDPLQNFVYLNDGAGTFSSEAIVFGEAREWTSCIAIGDGDGDGDLDLVSGNFSQVDRVSLNAEAPQPPTPAVVSVTPALNAGDVASTSNLQAVFDLPMEPPFASSFIVRARQTGLLTGPFSHPNPPTHAFDPNGTFKAGERIEAVLSASAVSQELAGVAPSYVWRFWAEASAGPAYFASPAGRRDFGSGAEFSQAIAAGDMTGDGELDIVVGVFGQNLVFPHSGADSPTTPTFFGSGIDPTAAIALGDMDNDGDLDIVSGNRPIAGMGSAQNVVYFNDGAGGFAETQSPFGAGADPTYAIGLGDLNGDGYLDIVVGNYLQANRVYFNDGQGNFVFDHRLFGTGADRTRGIDLGDIDQDGDLDIVVGNDQEQDVIYLNDGWGNFGTSQDVGASDAPTRSVTLADLDGDGDLDLLIASYEQQDWVYFNDGQGGFGGAPAGLGPADSATSDLAAGDLDGDGDIDIAAAHINQANAVYFNQGAGSFAGPSFRFGGPFGKTTGLAAGDFNGDGALDLVMAEGPGQDALLFNANFDAGDVEFSDVENVDSATDTDNREIALVTDGQGNWIAVWVSDEDLEITASPLTTLGEDDDILVIRSTDNAKTWTAPAALNSNAAVDFDSDVAPALATDRLGRWVAAWQSDDPLTGIVSPSIGNDDDILFSISSDRGASWGPLAPLGDAASDVRTDSAPQVTTDGSGNWIVAWTSQVIGGNPADTWGSDKDLFFVTSDDDATTWSQPAMLNDNAEDDGGDDERLDLEANILGISIAVWDSTTTQTFLTPPATLQIGADRDILFARSSDSGLTWTDPKPLNDTADTDSGSDKAPSIATDGLGVWMVAWSSAEDLGAAIGTDTDILVAVSSDEGLTWGAPIVVNSFADTDSADDLDPQVSADAMGNWFISWRSDIDTLGSLQLGTDFDALYAHSMDNGQNWSAALPLNPDAETDDGDDETPLLINDGSGQWTSLWASNDSSVGFGGANRHIFMSSSISLFVAPAEPADPTPTPTPTPTATPTPTPMALAVVAQSPAPNTTTATAASTVTATFNGAVAAATAQTFRIQGSMSGAFGGTFNAPDPPGADQVFTPSRDFLPGEEISVTLTDLTQTAAAPTDFLQPPVVWRFRAEAAAEASERTAYFQPAGAEFLGAFDLFRRNTTSVALGDLNRDGALDLVVGNILSRDEIYLSDGTPKLAQFFDLGIDPKVEAAPQLTTSVLLIDVDRNGTLDIVLGNMLGAWSFSVAMNWWDNQSAPAIQIPDPDATTMTLASGDFNADGYPDIVAGNEFGQNVVYLNTQGPDLFLPAQRLGPADNLATLSLAVGDVDGDGSEDIVVGNHGENLIYLNNGYGVFDEGSAIAFGSGADYTTALALGDIDGDSDLDIVEGSGRGIELYFNNGDGTFASPTSFEPEGDAFAVEALILADIDGDSNLDLAVGNWGGIPNYVYLNGGDGTFSLGRRIFGVGWDWTKALAVGDLDGDKFLDIVAGNDSGLGDPAFERNSISLHSGINFGFDSPLAMLNSNAALDSGQDRGPRIAANGSAWVSVWSSDTSGEARDDNIDLTLPGSGLEVDSIGSDSDILMAVSLAGDGTQWSKPFPLNSSAADDAGDISEISILVGRDQQLDELQINDGEGFFFRRDPILFDLGDGLKTTNAIKIGDLNNNGRIDFVIGYGASEANHVFFQDEFGGYLAQAPYHEILGTAKDTRAIALGDFNDDGYLDVAEGNTGASGAQNYLHRSDGRGGFETAIPIGPASSKTFAVATAHLNNDNLLDFIVGNDGQYNLIYLQSDTNTFETQASTDTFGSSSSPTRAIEVGDIDGDGDLDIVVGNFGGQDVVYLVDRSGETPSFTTISFGTGTDATQAIALADVDGVDGLDIIVGTLNEQDKVYLQDAGGGGFTSSIDFGPVGAHDTRSVGVGDIDGDELLDVAAGYYGAVDTVYLQDAGGASFTETRDFGGAGGKTQAIVLGVIQKMPSDEAPDIKTDGKGNWVVVWNSHDSLNHMAPGTWADDEIGIGKDSDLLFTRLSGDPSLSRDWEPVKILNSYADGDNRGDFDVNLDVSSKSDGTAPTWIAVWGSVRNATDPDVLQLGGDFDILFTRSTDGGRTWSDVDSNSVINSNAATDGGPNIDKDKDANSEIAAGKDDVWVVVWDSNATTITETGSPPGVLEIGEDSDILYARSTDDGVTWSDPALINSTGADDSDGATEPKDEDGLATIATDGFGRWVTVWISDDPDYGGGGAGADMDLVFATSDDNGATWSDSKLLLPDYFKNDDPTVNAANDFWPQVSTDKQGNWIVVWCTDDPTIGSSDPVVDYGTDFDVVYAFSSDNGATWNGPEILNGASSDGDVFSGVSFDCVPRVASNGAYHWIIGWESNDPDPVDDTTNTHEAGADFDLPYVVPVLTEAPPLPFEPVAASSFPAESTPPPTPTPDPQPTPPSGTPTPTPLPEADYDFCTECVEPNYSYFHGDTGFDLNPHIATDGVGRWIAVWQSNQNYLPGMEMSSGLDYDILIQTMDDARSGGDAAWSDPVLLHSSMLNDTDVEGAVTRDIQDMNPQIATDGAATWMAVWIRQVIRTPWVESDDKKIEVVRAVSIDSGQTWSAPMIIADIPNIAKTYRSADLAYNATELTPRIASDGADGWLIAWTTTEDPIINPEGEKLGIGDDHDILFIYSADDGTNWSDPAPLNKDAYIDNDAGDEMGLIQDGAPTFRLGTFSESGFSIAFDGGSTWVAAWHSVSGAHAWNSTDDPDYDIQAASATVTSGVMNWGEPEQLTDDGNFRLDVTPDIKADGTKWLVVYASGSELDYNVFTNEEFDIRYAKYDVSAGTWTKDLNLNTNLINKIPRTPQTKPKLATDGEGNWIAIWMNQREEFGDSNTTSEDCGGSTILGCIAGPPHHEVQYTTWKAGETGWSQDFFTICPDTPDRYVHSFANTASPQIAMDALIVDHPDRESPGAQIIWDTWYDLPRPSLFNEHDIVSVRTPALYDPLTQYLCPPPPVEEETASRLVQYNYALDPLAGVELLSSFMDAFPFEPDGINYHALNLQTSPVDEYAQLSDADANEWIGRKSLSWDDSNYARDSAVPILFVHVPLENDPAFDFDRMRAINFSVVGGREYGNPESVFSLWVYKSGLFPNTEWNWDDHWELVGTPFKWTGSQQVAFTLDRNFNRYLSEIADLTDSGRGPMPLRGPNTISFALTSLEAFDDGVTLRGGLKLDQVSVSVVSLLQPGPTPTPIPTPAPLDPLNEDEERYAAILERDQVVVENDKLGVGRLWGHAFFTLGDQQGSDYDLHFQIDYNIRDQIPHVYFWQAAIVGRAGRGSAPSGSPEIDAPMLPADENIEFPTVGGRKAVVRNGTFLLPAANLTDLREGKLFLELRFKTTAGGAIKGVVRGQIEWDLDGDGLSDYYEVGGAFDPSGSPLSASAADDQDSDDDGLSDFEEHFGAGRLTLWGPTDPVDWRTLSRDRDALSDGLEVGVTEGISLSGFNKAIPAGVPLNGLTSPVQIKGTEFLDADADGVHDEKGYRLIDADPPL